MDDKQLKKIQDEIMGSLNADDKADEEIKNLSEEIAAKLTLEQKTKVFIEEREYTFAYKMIEGKKRMIIMFVADTVKYNIVGNKYAPYTVKAEIDNDFTMRENLQSVVEAFIRHKLDRVKAQEV